MERLKLSAAADEETKRVKDYYTFPANKMLAIVNSRRGADKDCNVLYFVVKLFSRLDGASGQFSFTHNILTYKSV